MHSKTGLCFIGHIAPLLQRTRDRVALKPRLELGSFLKPCLRVQVLIKPVKVLGEIRGGCWVEEGGGGGGGG